MNIKRPSEK